MRNFKKVLIPITLLALIVLWLAVAQVSARQPAGQPAARQPAAQATADATQQVSPDMASSLLSDGITAYSNQQLPQALFNLSMFILLNPTELRGYYVRGLTYLAMSQVNGTPPDEQQNDLDNALADINRALSHDDASAPNLTAELHNLRAKIYLNQGLDHYHDAIAEYDIAIALSPNDPSFYRGRGQIYYAQQNYQTALADLNNAIQLDSTTGANYLLRAAINSQLNNPADAASDFLHWIASNQTTLSNESEMRSGDSLTLQMDTGVVFHIPFTAKSGDKISIAAAAASGMVDPLVVITDAQGNPLIADDDGGGQVNSLIQNYAAPADGTYTLVVSYSGGGATGTVMVQLQIQPP